jgi:hypothetical protein
MEESGFALGRGIGMGGTCQCANQPAILGRAISVS